MKRGSVILKRLFTAICIMALIIPVFNLQTAQAKTAPKLSKTQIIMTDSAKSYTLKVSSVKKSEKVKWSYKDDSANGKNCIKLVKKNKKTVVIKPLVSGNGTITCKVGKKNLTCRFTVSLSEKTSYEQYYRKLWDYVEDNGYINDDLNFEMGTDDFSDYDDTGLLNYAEITIEDEEEYSEIWMNAFASTTSEEDYSDYSFMVILSFNKEGVCALDILTSRDSDLIFFAKVADIDPENYRNGITDLTYEIEKNPYGFSYSDIKKISDSVLPGFLESMNYYLKSKVGFGLKELGFSQFS